jgi:hypothetical protein
MGPSENAKRIIRETAGEVLGLEACVRLLGSRLDEKARLDTEEAAALDIFLASVSDSSGFDPGRDYAPKEREPLDALSDRYLREKVAGLD